MICYQLLQALRAHGDTFPPSTSVEPHNYQWETAEGQREYDSFSNTQKSLPEDLQLTK